MDPQKQAAALRWRDALWEQQAGRLSWQVLNEFYWNATRKLRVAGHVARTLVESYSKWATTGFSLPLIQRAWHWTDSAGISYWDALILAAAERSGCRRLLSEDFSHAREYGAVEVVNPFLVDPEH